MNEEEEFLPGGFGELLRQAQEMQEQLAQGQAAAAGQVFEGHAGGGTVKVTVDGTMEFHSVTIDPEAVDPGDVGMLEDVVLAALRDAVEKVRAAGFGAAGDPSGPGALGGMLGAGGLGDLLSTAGLGGAGGGGLSELMGSLEQMFGGLTSEGQLEDEEAGGFLAAGELDRPQPGDESGADGA